MRIGFWILVFGILLPFGSIAQDLRYPNRPFQPFSVNGAIKLGGGYRYQESTTNQILNIQETPVIYAGFLLNTSSYVLNPGIMIIDLGGEYNPEYRRDDQLVIPDRTESRTLKRLDAGVHLLRSKPINLGITARFSEGFTNRENLTNLKANGSHLGAYMNWENRLAPFRMTYDQGDWEELETETGRQYNTNNKRLQANINRSFSWRDKNEFIYFYRDYQRIDAFGTETRNISNNFNLSNSLQIDSTQTNYIRSLITGTDQIGTDAFRRLFSTQSINLKLFRNLDFLGNYTFSSNKRESQDIKQNYVRTLLKHQLYESLTTSLIYEFNKTTQTYYFERRNKFGIDLRYQKKIPMGGRLLITGEYYKQPLKHESETDFLQILDEEHLLRDGELELLNRPNAITSSVIVKDPTGTIIYQEFFDYVLIEQNVYLEIQRIAGGQIPNNSTILVDYMIKQEGSFQYHLNYLRLHVRLMAFNRIIEVYYTRAQQDYSNQVNTEKVTLNYLTQNIYGLKLEYKFAIVGAEFEKYSSSITPFDLWRYYVQLQGNAKGKLLYSLNANYRDYHMRYNDTYQSYADVMGNLAYSISPAARLSLELGYRKQIGEGIDLDLFTSRLEFNMNYRKLFLRAGVELYSRIYLGENLDYYNVYLKLTRTFDWNK